MLDNEIIKKIAKALVDAEDNHTYIEKISEKYPDIEIEDSYKIQKEVFKIKENRGEKIIGKKIGLTSEGIRKQIGVYEPDFSLLTDKNILKSYQELELDKLNNPKLEPELTFILKEDLKGPIVSNVDVIKAILGVTASFEVVDTRYKDYNFKIFDTIADSASYGKIITSNKIVPIDNLDLDNIGLNVFKNGKLLKTATSAEVMGNPINSIVWLANKMIELGEYLKKGDLILSGSFTPVFDLNSGDFYEADFAGVGKIKLNIK